jgi:hypothetical protein
VALDLARELVGDQVDRVLVVPRRVLGAQRDALEVEGRLGHHVVGIGRVALLRQLDLERRQFAHLLVHLLEPPRDHLAQIVGDLKVSSLDLDPHGTPLVSGPTTGMLAGISGGQARFCSTIPLSGRHCRCERNS